MKNNTLFCILIILSISSCKNKNEYISHKQENQKIYYDNIRILRLLTENAGKELIIDSITGNKFCCDRVSLHHIDRNWDKEKKCKIKLENETRKLLFSYGDFASNYGIYCSGDIDGIIRVEDCRSLIVKVIDGNDKAKEIFSAAYSPDTDNLKDIYKYELEFAAAIAVELEGVKNRKILFEKSLKLFEDHIARGKGSSSDSEINNIVDEMLNE